MSDVIEGRRRLGFDAAVTTPGHLAETLSGRGNLVLALASFAAVEELVPLAAQLVGPEARASLGMSRAAYSFAFVLQHLVAVVAAMLMARRLARRPRRTTRARIAKITVLVASAGAFGAALAGSSGGFLWALAATGAATAAVHTVHRPLIVDVAAPSGRVRALSLHRAGGVLGLLLAALAIVVISSSSGASWRTVMLAAAAAGVTFSLVGIRISEPDQAADGQAVRTWVAERDDADASELLDPEQPPFMETLRRLWQLTTVRRTLICWAFLGVILLPLVSRLFFVLSERYGMDLGHRAAVAAAGWALALPIVVWLGSRADADFASDPSALPRLGVKISAVLVVALPVTAFSAAEELGVIGMVAVLAASTCLVPVLSALQLSVVHPAQRNHAGAMSAAFCVGLGGVIGSPILGTIDNRWGAAWAVGLSAIPAAIGALVLRQVSVSVSSDVDNLVTNLVQEAEVGLQRAHGRHLPLLTSRHIDFAYGQVQVLFDVNFSVDDGEMVALLGTNGAGKSTLLSCLSGLGFPSRGHVFYRGNDITYIDASRRVSQGITQVPGGQAVFGPLTVLDNLRIYGFSLGRDKSSVDRGIEAAFEAFPRLGERRHQLASTLSGGEQQMLALGKAMIVKPQLLLIDELSLGLAPKVVKELMGTVRAINAEGTAVVLVEQSVSTALELVDHAYFMEKGEIKFDGRAQELLDRPDLLRSVFLGGAAAHQG